jgi:hypothetical protein
MRMSKLIPQQEAPPTSGTSAATNWRLVAIGAAVGVAVGAVAVLFGASPWWWLAVPVGAALGASEVEPPILWGNKHAP